MITWIDYVRWAHESGTRKSGPGVPDHERAALMKIWGFGLGGEALEFLTEVLGYDEPIPGYSDCDLVVEHITAKAKLEAGDCFFYLARMYRDTGNERRESRADGEPSLKRVVKHVGDVVECMKKAFRSEGDAGLLRLCWPECDVFCDAALGSEKPRYLYGRREEFGVLLDCAIGAFEAWLVARGSSLSEVCELNVEKLVKRRKEGLISAQGERVSELGRAVRPEEIKDSSTTYSAPTPKRSG